MSSILQQIEDFTSGSASEYAFPAGLSVKERKLVKTTADKLGLSSRSFGMGSDRQIHIFKAATPMTVEPVKYAVKNTFVDGPVDEWSPAMEQASVSPAHQSMPAGALQEHMADEQSGATTVDQDDVDDTLCFGTVNQEDGAALAKVHASPRNSEADTSSTKDSDTESHDAPISIKNTFVHFETDSNVDPRIVQSMPAGTFTEKIEDEVWEAFSKSVKKKKRIPSLLSSEAETELSTLLFPSTPNAENQMSFDTGHTVPMVHYIPAPTTTAEPSVSVLPSACWAPVVPATTGDPSVTVLPAACWAPAAPAQPLAQRPPAAPSQAPPEGLLQGSATPMPPQAPPPARYFVPGTPVVLQGLANQSNFNGLSGVVSNFDADTGRYNVMIESGPNASKRLVKVKSQNLILSQPPLVPQPPVPQPPCCIPVQPSAGVSRPAKAALVLDQMI